LLIISGCGTLLCYIKTYFILNLFIFQFLNHYFTNKAEFSYATVALKQRTVTNLIEFIYYVLNCMENGVHVDAIYTDSSKAFNKVSHRRLLRKLAKLGFSGSFLACISSYLTDREQFVQASGSQSRRFSVRSGVPVVIWSSFVGLCSLFYS
jgi:hypothetical protein